MRIAAFLSLLLALVVGTPLPGAEAAVAPRDLDVQVSSGSPLDWLSSLPRPIPTVHRTRLGGEAKRMTQVEEPPHVQATDVFSFARITTVDLIGEIPWTTRKDETKKAYPPRVKDDVLWLAKSVFLRRLLHPAQVNNTEAFEYLTYLGEPALMAASMARNESSLRETIKKLKLYVSDMPRDPPEYVKGKDDEETMMLRLTWDDLTHAHPFSLDQEFAKRIVLLGDEAIPWVIRASKSGHSFLHRNAIVLLGRYDSPKAMERLREVVTSDLDPVSRIRAVDGLVRKRDPYASDLFIERVDKVHEKSFKCALIRGLGVLGNKKAIDVITKTALRDTGDFDLLCTCLTALARLAPTKDKYPDVERLVKKALRESFQDPNPTYSPVLPDKPDTRNEIINQLCMLVRASRRDERATNEMVSRVKDARKSGEKDEDRSVTRGLINTFHAPVIYALLQVMGKSLSGQKLLLKVAANKKEELTVRCHALIELARSNPPDLKKWLMPFIDLTEDQPVVETAFRILAALSPLDAEDPARKLVAAHEFEIPKSRKSVILLAVRFLAMRKKLGADRMIAVAETEILSEERGVKEEPKKQEGRRYAVRQIDFITPVPFLEHVCVEIGRAGGKHAVPILRDILAEPKLPGRAECAIGLGAIRSPAAWKVLARSLSDEDPWVRLMAYRAIKYSMGKAAWCDWMYAPKEEREKAAAKFRAWVSEGDE